MGLTDTEILAYMSITGRGAVSVGEISIHARVPELEAEKIVKKLLNLGLLKEIPGKVPRYQAIPPYTALLKQLDDFQNVISELRKRVPEELKSEFTNFVDSMGEITGLQDFLAYVRLIKDEVPKAM
ncbi:MAG: helix-turn-helix domain-containing protein, partial [Candidatus Helarchaeota archaeon]